MPTVKKPKQRPTVAQRKPSQKMTMIVELKTKTAAWPASTTTNAPESIKIAARASANLTRSPAQNRLGAARNNKEP